jgi:hypothetical protein
LCYVCSSLDDDIWDIRFNFPGEDNLERTLCCGDITPLNLLALVEGHGYGFEDKIYYVKEKGKGWTVLTAWQRCRVCYNYMMKPRFST